MHKKIKVAFLHSNCKSFRYPIFKGIAEKVDIDFFLLEKPYSTLNCLTLLNSFRVPLFQDLVIPFGLTKKLKKNNYDIIISTDLGYAITYIGFYAACKTNAKFILWNEQWTDIIHPRRWLTKCLEQYIVRKSYKLLAFGNKQKKFLISYGAKSSQIIHVPNVVPNSSIPFKHDLYTKDVVKNDYILCFGRLIKVKGQESLIRAFHLISSQYPTKKLLLAGEGPEYSKLRSLVLQLGLSGKVIIPNKKVLLNQKYRLINESEMVVLPSIRTRTTEAWGLVVNEASMLSKSIIVSDCTGVADDLIIHNSSGLIFPQNNEVQLSKCIKTYIEQPDFARKMGMKAKDRINEYFNEDTLINKITGSFDV